MNSYGRAGMRSSCTTKSIGVYSCGARPCRERDPLKHITAERSREKEKWHLSQPITILYGCSLLAAIAVASRLYATVAALPIPPEVLNINGVKDPCSTSRTHDFHMHGISPPRDVYSKLPSQGYDMVLILG